MTHAAALIAEDLRPRGVAEQGFAALSRLPGRVGGIGYRKLKRRMQHRAEARFQAMAARLGAGDIALDLGANVGDLTALMATGGATIHAFEPEPETFGLLTERFKDAPHVHPRNAAVADYNGTAQLVLPASFADIPRSASKAASIAHDRYRTGNHLEAQTDVVDIVEVVRALPARPKLIKIDIEGAEWTVLEALRGAGLLAGGTCLFVETHERMDPTTLPTVRAWQAWAAAQTDVYVNFYWG